MWLLPTIGKFDVTLSNGCLKEHTKTCCVKVLHENARSVTDINIKKKYHLSSERIKF